jgi:hypothetical protein
MDKVLPPASFGLDMLEGEYLLLVELGKGLTVVR